MLDIFFYVLTIQIEYFFESHMDLSLILEFILQIITMNLLLSSC